MIQTKLKDIVLKIESGSRPKGGIKNNTGTIPSLGAEHLMDSGGINISKMKFVDSVFFKNLNSGVIEQKDILVVKDGATTGKVSYLDKNFPYEVASINEHVFRLKIDENKGCSKYVYWYLKSSKGHKQILLDFRGATVGGITKSFLDKIIFPLPTLFEQKRIADLLDKVDVLRRKRKQSIQLLDDYLKSVFYDMFGDPVKNDKGWKIKLFGEIIKSIRYGTGSPPVYSEIGIPFIRATNIKGGTVVENELKFITEEEAYKIAKCKITKNNLIIVRSGVNSGDCAIINDKYSGSYAGYDLIVDIDYPYSVFYNYLINLPYCKSVLLPLSRRAGQPHLNSEQIQRLIFFFPIKNLQIKFAQIVEQVEKTKSKMQENLKELENLFNSLMNNFLNNNIY